MINYIKRKDLNVVKYNACIENSMQSRIYAYSWYLDIVADNWDVLVLDDYEAVMPIPWKKKYFLKYIKQPYFCQQLGVFSTNEISNMILIKFIKSIPNVFVKTYLQFNSKNALKNENITKKENYILNLKNEYSSIKKQFSKGRKHAIKVAEKLDLTTKNILASEIFKISRKYYSSKVFENKQYDIIEKLCTKYPNKVEVLGVFNQQNLFLGGAVFLKDKHRFTYLYSSFSDEGKKTQAASFLINLIIKNKSNMILDFEGSIVYGIASFYRSFGAQKEEYFLYESNSLKPFD